MLTKHPRLSLPLAMLLLVAGCAPDAGERSDDDRAAPVQIAAEPGERPRLAPQPPQPQELAGRVIAVVCDADVENPAGTSRPSEPDTLALIPLPLPAPATGKRTTFTIHRLPVSSSMLAAGSLALSPDARTAYIVEHRGPAPADAAPGAPLPKGAKLTSVDITDPAHPRVISEQTAGISPSCVAVRPQGDMLAVLNSTPGEQLVITPTRAGTLGTPGAFELPGLEARDVEVSAVAWHPSGRYLAVTLPGVDRVAFYEFTPDGNNGGMGLARYGPPVNVGPGPFAAGFTPDGRHLVVAQRSRGGSAAFLGAPIGEGSVSVIELSRVGSELADGPLVSHRVTGTAHVGPGAESLAISPGGSFIVVASLVRDVQDPGAGGALTLLGLGGDGQLTAFDTTPIAGTPKGLAFDATGQNLIVCQTRSSVPGVGGELSFYRLATGAQPRLIPGAWYAGVGIGPHGVVVGK